MHWATGSKLTKCSLPGSTTAEAREHCALASGPAIETLPWPYCLYCRENRARASQRRASCSVSSDAAGTHWTRVAPASSKATSTSVELIRRTPTSRPPPGTGSSCDAHKTSDGADRGGLSLGRGLRLRSSESPMATAARGKRVCVIRTPTFADTQAHQGCVWRLHAGEFEFAITCRDCASVASSSEVKSRGPGRQRSGQTLIGVELRRLLRPRHRHIFQASRICRSPALLLHRPDPIGPRLACTARMHGAFAEPCVENVHSGHQPRPVTCRWQLIGVP